MSGRSAERLEAYELRTAPVMVGLAFAFIGVYAFDVLVISPPAFLGAAATGLSTLIWGTFAVDLGIRVWMAPERGAYLLRHPVDVLAVVVPAFRSLRLLRVFTAAQWLVRRGAKVALGKTAAAIAVTAASVAFIGGLAVLDAERGAPGSHIETLGDALWWAVVTMSTVGYGDVFPVTTAGRMVGVAMMVVGVSMLGIVTATVAAWFLEKVRGQEQDDAGAVRAELAALRQEQAATRAEIVALREALGVREGLG